jgi:hypothetical protein
MEGTMSIYPGMLLTYLSSSGVGFVGVGRDVRAFRKVSSEDEEE